MCCVTVRLNCIGCRIRQAKMLRLGGFCQPQRLLAIWVTKSSTRIYLILEAMMEAYQEKRVIPMLWAQIFQFSQISNCNVCNDIIVVIQITVTRKKYLIISQEISVRSQDSKWNVSGLMTHSPTIILDHAHHDL